jgi:pimeloyl-ACP methyl ester carboxylesterase
VTHPDQTAVTAPTQFVTAEGVTFAYRRFGPTSSRPVVFFNHLAANLDNFDPAVLDGISRVCEVIAFDNKGVGSSSGETPRLIETMADDAADFIKALAVGPVDVLALSMGGMVAQELALRHPSLVNKLVLVGTGPRGGKGIDKVTLTTLCCMMMAALTKADPKEFIFFKRNSLGKAAAKSFLLRLAERVEDRDTPVSIKTFRSQLKAISIFGRSTPSSLVGVKHESLVINGDHDIMVPTQLSAVLASALPNGKLDIYADAGHGSLFQQPDRFVAQVLRFLKQ